MTERVAASQLPWVDRYRPRTFDDLYGQEHVVEQLRAFLDDPLCDTMPNLLLVGAPGTGKTSTMWCVARHVFGNAPDALASAVKEVNGSRDCKAETVVNEIRPFVSTLSDVARRCGHRKMLIIDEAEAMTPQAQQLLRELMDEFRKHCHFSITCNDLTNIIHPLQSRCTVLQFGPLAAAHTMYGILRVVRAQKVQFTQEGVEALMFVADGDMRKAINVLQAVATTWGVLSAENIYRVSDLPPIRLLRDLFAHCFARRLVDALHVVKRIVERGGYGVADVVETMQRLLRTDPSVTHDDAWLLAHAHDAVGSAHQQTMQNRDDMLVLSALVARLCIESERMQVTTTTTTTTTTATASASAVGARVADAAATGRRP